MDNNIQNTGYDNMVPGNDNNVYSDNSIGQSYVTGDTSQQQVINSNGYQQNDISQQTMNVYQEQVFYPSTEQAMYQSQTVQSNYQTGDPNQVMYQGQVTYPTVEQPVYQTYPVQVSYQTGDPNQVMYQGQVVYPAVGGQQVYQSQTVQPNYQTVVSDQTMYQAQSVQNGYSVPNQNVQQQTSYQTQAGYSMPNQGVYPNNMMQGVPNIGGVPVLPTANSYPNLGAISQQSSAQSPQYNANMIQTGPKAFQNTGASRVGKMQTAIRRKTPLNEPPLKKPFPIKKIFFFLLITITAFFVYFYFFYDETTREFSANLNSIFDTNKPVLIKNFDKLYGYIKTNGEVIVEPQYEAGTEFYGGYAGVISSFDDEEYEIINKKGEVVVSAIDGAEPEYLIDWDTWIIGEEAYSGKMKKLHDDNTSVEYLGNGMFSFKNMEKEQSGIMDYEGKVLFTTSGIEGVKLTISYSSYNKDDMFVFVSTPEKRYIVSTKTTDIVYTFEDPNLNVKVYDNGIFSVSKSSASDYYYNYTADYLYFYNGEFVFEAYDIEHMYLIDYEKQVIMIEKGSLVEYYDVLNKVKTSAPPGFSKYDFLYDDDDKDYGYEKFSCNDDDYEGVMQNNEIILACENDYVEFLPFYLFKYIKSRKGQELTFLKRGNNRVLYDLKLKRDVEEWEFVKYSVSSSSVLILLRKYTDPDMKNSDGYIVYNLLTGKYLEFDSVLSISISASSFKVYENSNNIKYYNAKMKEIYEVEYS